MRVPQVDRQEHLDSRWGSRTTGKHARPYDYAAERATIMLIGSLYVGRHAVVRGCAGDETCLALCGSTCRAVRKLGNSGTEAGR